MPVILIGNKSDLAYDRMVSPDDGEKMCHDLGCSAFKELSVRENIDEVIIVNQPENCFNTIDVSVGRLRLL